MAKEIKSVVKIGMNYTEVVGGTTEINRRIKLLDSDFRKTQESAKAFGTSVDELSNKQEYLTQKITLQTQKVKNMKDEYEKIKKEKGENSKEAEKYATSINYAERALIKLEAELKDTNEKLKDQSAKFEEAKKKMGEFSEKAKTVGEQTGKVGDVLLKASAPLIAFSVASGKMAMDFEEAMAKVSLMVDENEVDMNKLGESVKVLSNTYGISTKEIANALYETISAGIGVADSIKFLDVALKNGKAGIADTVTSVNTLTNVMNAYGIESEKALEISDKLLMLQKFGKTTVGEFGNEIGRIAPLAAQTGVSVEELFSSIATLTKNSIGSSEALTGMRSIVSAVISPTAEASKEAERLGLKFNASALRGKGFEKFLDDVMRKTRGNTDSLDALFGNINALNAIMVLTSNKGSKDFKEALDQINNSVGMTDEGMGKLDTSSMRLKQTIETLKNSFADAGESILPILNGILRLVTPLLNLISKIPEPVMVLIAGMGLFLGMSGGILKSISSIALGIGVLTGAIGGFTVMSTKAIGVILVLVAALTALLTLWAIIKGKAPEIGKVTNDVNSSVTSMQGAISNSVPSYAKVNGSHRSGLARVPRDGYIAELHKDEEILTANDPRNRNNKNGGYGEVFNLTLNVNMDEVDDVSKLVRIAKEFKQTKRAGTVRG